ncbi:MAG: hypothetical protein P1U75_14340 [Antarcticimicrobium sp.]|uniref:phosphorylase family protein n=1 Tax=Antarcticimicrobium sp. TaxID=2824147 RepID=UPI00261CAD42|nr:hypothetical protein [Antarcticimicrobium sp.]MDF1717831.1 hypothetical protein [Antarcticimicrobium sp.]
MQLLIIEDDEKKFAALKEIAASLLGGGSLEVVRASTMRAATREVYQTKYDLIIVDLMLPVREGEQEIDVSSEILEVLANSQLNKNTRAIAITGFLDLLDGRSRAFNELNIPIVYYSHNEDSWSSALSRKLCEIQNASVFDFVIVCALEKEREAFQYTSAMIGEKRLIRGLDCSEISIGGRKGMIVKPPRVGVVDSSITTTRVIESFKPRIVCMSGICAGIPGEVEIGDIVIAENCFEYQVGKWTKNGFAFELYQVPIPETVRALLSHRLLTSEVNGSIRSNLGFPELSGRSVKFVTHASGSAVVADKTKRDEIKAQHRKLASVEMEIFSVYRAASISIHEPLFFAAKGVVDDAGVSKDDKYHIYGAVTSARVIVEGLEVLLTEAI